MHQVLSSYNLTKKEILEEIKPGSPIQQSKSLHCFIMPPPPRRRH